MKYKKYDYDSFQIYTIQTDKFKNCYMEVNFRDDAENINVPCRNFLTDLLIYTSLDYPTKRDMIIKEEELYNLSGSGGSYRVGNNIFSYFSMDILHPKFVKETDYLENAIKFSMDLILKPNVKNGVWDERSYEIIKERLHTSIDQYKESAKSFAKVESRKILFPDSIIGKRIIGTHEEIDSIDQTLLYQEYLKMLQNSCCEILVIGDLDMDKVVKLITKYFHKSSIVNKNIPYTIENSIADYKKMNVLGSFQQTQLIQYYQFPVLSYREKNFVFPLFQKIFGASNLSDKLGKYLRMENSLCYSYSFSYFLGDSYSTVITQIKKENTEKAVTFIRKAFDEMKNGDFSEEELMIQKNKILSDLKLKDDSIYALIDNYYQSEIFDVALFEEYYHEIMSITREEIQNLARKLQLTFQYVLEEASDAED